MSDEVSPEDQAPAERVLKSGLVLDLDQKSVRATLFDTVEDQGRFVASVVVNSTTHQPLDDVSIAVRTAVLKLEEESGRLLLSENRIQSPADGFIGVDHVSFTGLPVRPPRLAIISTGSHRLSRQLVGTARTTTTIVGYLDNAVRTENAVMSGTLLETELELFAPDIILLIAGHHSQAEWPIVVSKLADMVREDRTLKLIILASEQLQQYAIQQLGENAYLTGLDPDLYSLDQVSGAVEVELQGVYEERLKTSRLDVSNSTDQFVSRGRARDLVTRFLARRLDQTVVTAEISDGTSVHLAGQTESWTMIRPEIDMNRNIAAILDLDLNRVLTNLPFDYTLEELHHWILNRGLRPGAIADLGRDQIIESALAGEIIRFLWSKNETDSGSQVDMIIGGPVYAAWDQRLLGVLSLLNAFEPKPASGLVEVVLDVDGIVSGAGAIGEMNPSLAADAVENDLTVESVSVVVVGGRGELEHTAVRGNVRYDNGNSFQFSVPFGSIYRLPTKIVNVESLTLICETGFSIGEHMSGANVNFEETKTFDSSILDIVIDARDKNPNTEKDRLQRQMKVESWYRDLSIWY